MVKAFYGLRRFEGRSTFRHWLQRIKVNHCLNHLKKHEGRSYIGVEEPEAGGFDQLRVQATAEHQAEVIGERELIARILNSMTETLRIPLVLCDMDELSYEEVAKVLGISLSAVKMRIKRAREDFRSRYLNMQTIVMEAGRR
jgi:RNA polymerase sigma-70 factor (ECF subfamily)